MTDDEFLEALKPLLTDDQREEIAKQISAGFDRHLPGEVRKQIKALRKDISRERRGAQRGEVIGRLEEAIHKWERLLPPKEGKSPRRLVRNPTTGLLVDADAGRPKATVVIDGEALLRFLAEERITQKRFSEECIIGKYADESMSTRHLARIIKGTAIPQSTFDVMVSVIRKRRPSLSLDQTHALLRRK